MVREGEVKMAGAAVVFHAFYSGTNSFESVAAEGQRRVRGKHVAGCCVPHAATEVDVPQTQTVGGGQPWGRPREPQRRHRAHARTHGSGAAARCTLCRQVVFALWLVARLLLSHRGLAGGGGARGALAAVMHREHM